MEVYCHCTTNIFSDRAIAVCTRSKHIFEGFVTLYCSAAAAAAEDAVRRNRSDKVVIPILLWWGVSIPIHIGLGLKCVFDGECDLQCSCRPIFSYKSLSRHQGYTEIVTISVRHRYVLRF